MDIDRIIQDKEAQLVILNAITLQMCECELCKKGNDFIKKVKKQIEKELYDARKFKK